MEKPSVFHVHLHKRLLEKCESDMTFDFVKHKFTIINLKIPKKLIYDIIKEMEEIGFGEKIDRTKFKLVKA